MAESIRARRRGDARVPMSAVITLASWRFRSTWFLLLVITLGMVAAVVIACAIPLFSTVMATAGVRGALRATPTSAEMTLNTETQRVSTPIVQAVQKQFEPLLHRYLGNALQPEQFVFVSNDFSLSSASKNSLLTVYGTSMQAAAPHLGAVQGRAARVTNAPASEIEVMMTPQSARQLKLHIGSTFNLSVSYITQTAELSVQVKAHLVGLFQVTPQNAAYWHGNDFNPFTFATEGTSTLYQYSVLVPDNALLALFDHIRDISHLDGAASASPVGYTLIWYYRFDPSSLTIDNLDAFIDRFNAIGSTVDSLYGNLESGNGYTQPIAPAYLARVDLTSPLLSTGNAPSILEQFRSRLDVARIPVGIFALLSIALILFFVSLLTAVLVDRQAETIAVLRTRGASREQVFGALLLQSAGLGLLALLIGLPLAALVVLVLAQYMLPASELDALNVITNNPLQAMQGTLWYALAVVLVALLTMSVSLFFAARMDVLSLRRETARSNKRPLWQRLNLDVIAGVVALVGYAISLYITSVGNVLSNDAKVLIATPLSIIAPFFLIIGCLFLFLRIFPLLLQLGARLATRGRGAASMLALAQIARSPRQSLRLTLLLALAVTFTLFTLIYNATEAQHIQEIVNYETGADFSAQLFSAHAPLSQVLKQYRTIPGVLSASAGFSDEGYGGTADLAMDIRAVDASTFGGTVIWPSQQAYQQALPLLAKLVTLRQAAIANDDVPAIVDQTTLNRLLLHVGSSFTVNSNSVTPSAIHCVIVGVLGQIPTINGRLTSGHEDALSVVGGVMIDYQTYASVYIQDVKQSRHSDGAVTPPAINQIWLHTKDDPVSLASVRAVLSSPQYRLSQLVDRRLLLDTLQTDPLYLILLGVLGLGTAAALLLALIGDVLVSWLSAYSRLTSFALLRALGITSRQVAGTLTWEQAIIYITGLLLGGGFGALLATSVIPALTFTNLNSNLSNEQFFALQSVLAAQLVVPPSLPLLLLVLVAIYIIALAVMVYVTTRSALGQSLRLSED